MEPGCTASGEPETGVPAEPAALWAPASGAALRARGHCINPEQVRRLMHEEGLQGVRKGRFVPRTTIVGIRARSPRTSSIGDLTSIRASGHG